MTKGLYSGTAGNVKLVSLDPPIYLLGPAHVFPDPRESDAEGLIAVGGDFAPMRLIAAYRRGIFPWFTYRKLIYWFSPDPRMILEPSRLHRSKSLERVIKSGRFEVRVDTNFKAVMEHCASVKRKEKGGTWITRPFIEAYCDLHAMGYAHSVETYRDGELVGGLYGVLIGSTFCGESMFARESDASKVALVRLAELSGLWGFDLIDCQVPSDHLKRMGGQEISRDAFLERIKG